MKTLTLREITEAVNGLVISGPGEALITGVSTDSRTVREGDVFIALIGARSDAHDYIGQVANAGAKAVIVSDREKALQALDGVDGVTAILVNDTLQALLDLGGYYLRSLRYKHVIGVTGSVGKTSKKIFLEACLPRSSGRYAPPRTTTAFTVCLSASSNWTPKRRLQCWRWALPTRTPCPGWPTW